VGADGADGPGAAAAVGAAAVGVAPFGAVACGAGALGVAAAAVGAGALVRTAGVGADGAGGVRVEGAEVSADGRGPGTAVGRGAPESGREGALGRGALLVVVPALAADGAPLLREAGADGRGAGASLGASFSRRRRITGASRVEEGDLTNSPMSFAIERTALLSTPSSFASS